VSEQTINARGMGSERRIYTVKWNHIGITCVLSDHECANQDVPAVVVVPAPQQTMKVNETGHTHEVQVEQEEAQPFVPKEYSEGEHHVNNQ